MKSMHLSAQWLRSAAPAALPPQQVPGTPTVTSTALPANQCSGISRRDLAICSSSSLLLLAGAQALEPQQFQRARAEELSESNEAIVPEENPTKTRFCAEQTLTKKAFLDVSIDGEPIGRIVIGLYGEIAPAGTARFSNLVSGAAGISYRRKEFVKIMPNYVQHGGVRSYGGDSDVARKTGKSSATERLIEEWEKQYESCPGTKNVASSVSLLVRDPTKPPPKLKLVARKGKLEIDEEEVGVDPNGTEFVIAARDSPELDTSALVIGRVLEGMEVVERIGQVKTVRENSSSPYFRVAKLIGDKRATVAERGFNRPYSKVMITNCGLMG